LNILKIATGVVLSNVSKPLSFIVGHDRVASVKGGNPQDSWGNSVPLEDGDRS